jgi:hypothetical protein
MTATEYTDYLSSFPVVRIRSPDTLSPSPAREIASPPFGSKWIETSLAEEGLGGPNSDKGTDSLVFYVYYNPSTIAAYPTIKYLHI